MTKRILTADDKSRWMCAGCLLWKDEWDFTRNKNMPNGLSAYCRICTSYNSEMSNRVRADRIRAEHEELLELRDRVRLLTLRNEVLEAELDAANSP